MIKKWMLITIGCITFVIGTIGIFVPFLPTTGFYLITAFCFGKSSKRLNNWFRNTKMYKNNFESYVERHAMTKLAKIKSTISVSIVFSIGMYFTRNKLLAFVVLFIIWICHIIYFIFGIKTEK